MSNRWDNYRNDLKKKLAEDAEHWKELKGEELHSRYFLLKMEEYYRWGRQSAFREKKNEI